MSAGGAPDPDALLVALVLVPASFSRNRYYHLYEEAVLRQARRRARLLRGILRELLHPECLKPGQTAPSGPLEVLEQFATVQEQVVLSYQIPAYGYQRQAHLSPLEAEVLQFALGKARGQVAPRELQARIEELLLRLSPETLD